MHDVLRTAEAIAEFGRSRVRRELGCGRWQRPGRGVIVLHNGPLTPLQVDLARIKTGAPGSALGGLSALAHDGFTGFEPDEPVLIVPAGSRRPDLDDVTVHWSEFLDDRDVHPHRIPPRTRPARSLIDAASWCPNDRYARAIVIAGVQQGLTSTAHIREALTRRGRCRRRGLVIESVLDAAGGIQSLPERDFDEIRVLAGLPKPQRQQRVQGKDGRFYLDVHIAEIGLSIEIHGIPHLAVRRWDADLRRANEIVIAGERLLIFSSYAIRHEQAAVIDQLQRMARTLRSAA